MMACLLLHWSHVRPDLIRTCQTVVLSGFGAIERSGAGDIDRSGLGALENGHLRNPLAKSGLHLLQSNTDGASTVKCSTELNTAVFDRRRRRCNQRLLQDMRTSRCILRYFTAL